MKKINWSKFISREGVDAATMSLQDLFFIEPIWKYAKTKDELFFTYYDKKIFTHYIGVSWLAVGRMLYKKYFNSPAKVVKYYQAGIVFKREFVKESRFWQRRLQGSDKDFLGAFIEFVREFKKVSRIYSITSFFGLEAWQSDCEQIIKNLIKKNHLSSEAAERVMFRIYRPWKKTALINLQDDIKKGIPVNKLIKKYQFLRSWAAIWYKPLDEDWIKNMRPKIEDVKIRACTNNQLFKLLNPNKKELELLHLFPYLIFFKDWRDDLRRLHAYSWSFFWEQLAAHFGCKPFDLGYLTLEEIKKAILQDRLPDSKINYRKNEPFIITSDGKDSKTKIIYQDIPKKYLEIIKFTERSASRVKVKGIIAQSGKAKGQVIIVKSFHDIKKVGPQHILIANTTHPNYLPAMQSVRAFVTNEGGVISHAAIVARELKKPCIVGTKNATQVFKDGDLVEVDAKRGVVKKL